MPDVADLVEPADPPAAGAIAEAAAARRRPASFFGEHGKLMIIAADHPARGALRAGADALAMADRADLLTGSAPRWPGPASTACSAPRTSSRTCCCSACSTTRW